MINRRQFLLGGAAVVASVPTVLPQIAEAVLAPADFDTANCVARYTYKTYSLGYAITEEVVEEEVSEKLCAAYTQALARSMTQTREAIMANVLNRAFTFGETRGSHDLLFFEEDDIGCCEEDPGPEYVSFGGDDDGATYHPIDYDNPDRVHQLRTLNSAGDD